MKGLQTQKGISLVFALLLTIVIAFVFLFTLRLAPIYMENFSVKTAMNSLVDEPRTQTMNKMELLTILIKRLSINHVRNVTMNNIKIKRVREGNRITVSYKVQKPLIANVDFIVTFNNDVVVPAR